MKLDDIAPQPYARQLRAYSAVGVCNSHQKLAPHANQWMPQEIECTTGLGDRITPAAPP
jgi:hypothetical protein